MQSPITTTITATIQNSNLTPSFPPKFPLNPLRLRPEFLNRRSSTNMASSSTSFGRFKMNSKLDNNSDGFLTISEYAGKGGVDVGDDLVVLFSHLEYAFKRIAALVASPANSSLGRTSGGGEDVSSGRDKPKPLDTVSNEIILSSLRKSGKVAVMASEEDDAPTWIADDAPFVVVTDPLDGSRNIDASIPTGTIFGIYNRLVELDSLPVDEKAMLNSLQSGSRLIAAGYVLYSSATIICTTFGSGSHAFTLDHSTGDFVLTHPNIKIPPRGQIYSVNDARYFDWPEGLRRYIDTIRQGKGKFPKKYSARYICSLVADLHRTLMYGGVAMNPRDHLRLVYEANPLSFVVEQAGGKGSDGKNRILSIQPVKLHQRLPLFLGSPDDIEELESYGDVQQTVNPGYDV
ncbi:Fructose-1,6-bisphosphatase class 1/Sedoheputulose-1,7-bisphosphatase [Cynara cardunculus var. scolymus]|uniref:fructose-bisphosphatase n=2 Tax=Cynara cardunculus var. scolymus TaxID=59895 RepID=A0A118K2Q2_CYNCS|nr:Fructose-1,6-bisphosphatase class 1/Sedoheputulose-1,7-bisphosphatase [Cynara cardunculus var. scolymus]